MGLSIHASICRVAAAGVFAVAVGVTAIAQTAPPKAPAATMIVEPPGPLLPTGDGLVAAGGDLVVPDDSAEVQAILKEDGLVRAESRVKLVPTASKPVSSGWVKAYQFVDATGALSAYTYFRDGGSRWPHAERNVNSTVVENGGGEVVFVSGTSVVRLKMNQHPDSINTLLVAIEVGLPKVAGRKSLPPLLPKYFPGDVSGAKLEAGTLRYALGPVGYQAMGGVLPAEILGWDKSAEVATASYTSKNGKGMLTLLLYPTPQIAGDEGRVIEKAINEKGPVSFGTVKMRRNGPLVVVTSGAFTAEQAETLMTAVHLDEIVTFDKPMPLEFHAEVRKTATLLQSILIFTALLFLAAVVIAIFLGGARAGYRVLRGKPAASEPEFLTINLRDQPRGLFAPREPGSNEPPAI